MSRVRKLGRLPVLIHLLPPHASQAGPGVQISFFHLSQLFPRCKSMILSIVTGSFQLGFSVFLLFKWIHRRTQLSFSELSLAYSILILPIWFLGLFVWPSEPLFTELVFPDLFERVPEDDVLLALPDEIQKFDLAAAEQTRTLAELATTHPPTSYQSFTETPPVLPTVSPRLPDREVTSSEASASAASEPELADSDAGQAADQVVDGLPSDLSRQRRWSCVSHTSRLPPPPDRIGGAGTQVVRRASLSVLEPGPVRARAFFDPDVLGPLRRRRRRLSLAGQAVIGDIRRVDALLRFFPISSIPTHAMVRRRARVPSATPPIPGVGEDESSDLGLGLSDRTQSEFQLAAHPDGGDERSMIAAEVREKLHPSERRFEFHPRLDPDLDPDSDFPTTESGLAGLPWMQDIDGFVDEIAVLSPVHKLGVEPELRRQMTSKVFLSVVAWMAVTFFWANHYGQKPRFRGGSVCCGMMVMTGDASAVSL